jgi:UDP-N-acetylmuramate--alanine ligase
VTSRTASEISAGLEPARAAQPLGAGQRIHVIGVAGAAAAAAALHAQRIGASVTGCDVGGPSQYTAPLEEAGIPVSWSHDPGHVVERGLPCVDRLAVTKALTAVAPEHPELAAARDAGILATSVQQLIADAAATGGQDLVAIAGTHGKSTTAGWVVHILAAAGLDPAAFVGALLPAELAGGRPSTARFGSGPHFVVEADEYAGNFDPYRPLIGGLTNADWDHPDVFPDRPSVVAAFAAWIRRFRGEGQTPVLVANTGDAGVRETVVALGEWPGRLLPVALVDEAADVSRERDRLAAAYGTVVAPAGALVARRMALGVGEGSLEIAGLEAGLPVTVNLQLPGRHNAENALVAAGVALAAGVAPPLVSGALGAFRGVGRRLELKADVGGVVVLDDYAHHPTAIAATFEAVARLYPGRRLWAVCEPLTYHRTAAMLGEFAAVLERADRVVIARIHAGRDPDTTITSAAALAETIRRRGRAPAWAPGTVDQTAVWLAPRVEPGDVVLVMGGGRSYVIAERLAVLLRRRFAG